MTRGALAGQKYLQTDRLASYYSVMLKVTELYNMTLSTANVCLWRLNGCMLDSMHLLVMGVAQIAGSNNQPVCPHTFVVENINIYVFIYDQQKENLK